MVILKIARRHTAQCCVYKRSLRGERRHVNWFWREDSVLPLVQNSSICHFSCFKTWRADRISATGQNPERQVVNHSGLLHVALFYWVLLLFKEIARFSRLRRKLKKRAMFTCGKSLIKTAAFNLAFLRGKTILAIGKYVQQPLKRCFSLSSTKMGIQRSEWLSLLLVKGCSSTVYSLSWNWTQFSPFLGHSFHLEFSVHECFVLV